MGARGKRETICQVCGKRFIPAGQHIYKVNGKYVCSDTCRSRYNKANPKRQLNRIDKW